MDIVGFTGTSLGMNLAQIRGINTLFSECKPNHSTVFHHGDCFGSDSQAHDIAMEYGFKVVVHPPNNDAKRAFKSAHESRYPEPYLTRNKDIVNDTEVLIATPDSEERTRSGTWQCVRYARKLHRPIYIILPSGEIRTENVCIEDKT